jgi:hypothetical protein
MVEHHHLIDTLINKIVKSRTIIQPPGIGISPIDRYGRAADDRHRRAGGEQQRREAEQGSPGS